MSKIAFADFAKLAFQGPTVRVAGTVTEFRGLGKKDNKNDIWRHLLKIGCQGLTLETVADDAVQHGETFKVGEQVVVDCRIVSGMGSKPEFHVIEVNRVAA